MKQTSYKIDIEFCPAEILYTVTNPQYMLYMLAAHGMALTIVVMYSYNVMLSLVKCLQVSRVNDIHGHGLTSSPMGFTYLDQQKMVHL